MKCVILLLAALCLSPFSYAGSANCTGTTTLTSPQTYGASSECIIRAEVPFISQGYVRITLPASPSIGDEFTLQENSDEDSWYDEESQTWYYWTGGVGFQTDGALMNYPGQGLVDQVANFTKGRYLKVIWDGTYWQISEGTF